MLQYFMSDASQAVENVPRSSSNPICRHCVACLMILKCIILILYMYYYYCNCSRKHSYNYYVNLFYVFFLFFLISWSVLSSKCSLSLLLYIPHTQFFLYDENIFMLIFCSIKIIIYNYEETHATVFFNV